MDPKVDQRERLKQVEQTDLTESRVNQDFIDWMKNSGPSWLLAILIVLVAIVGWDRYREYRTGKVAGAFHDLNAAADPESLQMVAADHRGIESVSELAWLGAADAYLLEAQIRRDFSELRDIEQAPLSDEAVRERLQQARDLYQRVYDATKNDESRPLLALQAQLGLAAVAESMGELDKAAAIYKAVENDATGPTEALIAEEARKRLASLDELKDIPAIPAEEDLPRAHVTDELIRDLLPPPAEETSKRPNVETSK